MHGAQMEFNVVQEGLTFIDINHTHTYIYIINIYTHRLMNNNIKAHRNSKMEK